ncbi:MAG: hypothetical protein WAM66_02185 [Acidobacteriaceae bacterium]
MTLEEFARIHQLEERWLDLRRDCNEMVERPDFWYRKELQNTAREFAEKASDLLTAAIKRDRPKPPS